MANSPCCPIRLQPGKVTGRGTEAYAKSSTEGTISSVVDGGFGIV